MKPDPNRLPSGEYPDTSTAAFTNTIPVVDSYNSVTPTEDGTPSRTELLPFTIRSITKGLDFARAASLRQSAYGRHLPEFAAKLGHPEPADQLTNTVVLLAESKLDRAPLATIRIHTNYGAPLPLEQTVSLPKKLQDKKLAEAVRLAIIPGREGHLPRDAIFKAFYLVCVAMNIDHMVICARNPLQKMYFSLHFTDVFQEKAFIPMTHIGGVPHRVLSLKTSDVEPLWRTNGQPLHNFFFNIHHPDIENFKVTYANVSRTSHTNNESALIYQ